MSLDEMFVHSVDKLALKCLFLIIALYNCSQTVNTSCCRTHVITNNRNSSSVSSTVTSNCVRKFIASQKKTQKEQRSCVLSTVTSNCVRKFIASQKKTQKEQRSCVLSTVTSNCVRKFIASQKKTQKEQRRCVSSTAAVRYACQRHVITNT